MAAKSSKSSTTPRFRKTYDSPRALLVSLGEAKPGRGRLSAKGHAIVAQARAKGVTFTSEQPTVGVGPLD